MWNKQLTAFTIMELLVTMTITAILVTMAFSAYLLFQKQYFFFVNSNNEAIKAQQLTNILQWDAFYAQYMVSDQGRLIFQMEDVNQRSYRFYPDFILRSTLGAVESMDTFFISGSLHQMSLNGEIKEHGVIDRCQVHFQYFGRSASVCLTKRYSAHDLLNVDQHEH